MGWIDNWLERRHRRKWDNATREERRKMDPPWMRTKEFDGTKYVDFEEFMQSPEFTEEREKLREWIRREL